MYTFHKDEIFIVLYYDTAINVKTLRVVTFFLRFRVRFKDFQLIYSLSDYYTEPFVSNVNMSRKGKCDTKCHGTRVNKY